MGKQDSCKYKSCEENKLFISLIEKKCSLCFSLVMPRKLGRAYRLLQVITGVNYMCHKMQVSSDLDFLCTFVFFFGRFDDADIFLSWGSS